MKKMSISELKIGMFVEELDRPWIETPFPLQGFPIKSENDIKALGVYSEHVFITFETVPTPRPPTTKWFITHAIPEDNGEKTQFHGDYLYPDTVSLQEEMPAAIESYGRAEKLIDQIKLDINQNLKLDVDIARELVDVIAGSVIKNPDALLILNQLKTSNEEYYGRALNTAIHMIAFGRHLCLPSDELSILGLGGLLMDIGQLKQHANLKIDKAKDHHVLYGEQILSQIPSIPEKVLQIACQHHEREDGTGYPHGLSGNLIATYAKMAAIVDIYENMVATGISTLTSPVSPFEAVKILWDLRRTWLNATLVQQFAHCIGLFPVGSLIELNTGEVAIVLTQSRTNRMQPTVMIVLDKDKQAYDSPVTIDLAANPEQNTTPYEIVRDLKPAAYNIDPEKYYL